MARVIVRAYPHAEQFGNIEVPDNLTASELKKYIRDHWNDIDFEEPELDYDGTDFYIYS